MSDETKCKPMLEKYLLEPHEMSVILWSLEGSYTKFAKSKSEMGKRCYIESKKLHEKLWKEFMSN